MRALKFNAPRGPFRFNPVTQSPIQNVYIREVAEIDGHNKVIATPGADPRQAHAPHVRRAADH